MNYETPLLDVVDLISPPFGAILHGQLSVRFLHHEHEESATTSKPLAGLPEVEFNVLGIMQNTFDRTAQTIESTSGVIEPASWFFQLAPKVTFEIDSVSAGAVDDGLVGVLYGYPTYGYIEFVLSDEEIAANRLYNPHSHSSSHSSPHSSSSATRPLLLDSNHFATPPPEAAEIGFSHEESGVHSKPSTIRICIWGSNVMDGQKQIWLQQIESMQGARFAFTWILSLPEGQQLSHAEGGHANPDLFDSYNSVLKRLVALPHCRVVDSPFNGFSLKVEELLEAPTAAHHENEGEGENEGENEGEGEREVAEEVPELAHHLAAAAVWRGELGRLYLYAHERFVAARRNISLLSPSWVRLFYERLHTFLLQQRCDVLVYGNSRGFSSDVFITDVSAAMQIPTVTELLNLFADPRVLPDAVVAPSLFALQHESVAHLADAYARTRGRRWERRLETAVIQPGVDAFGVFHPINYAARRDAADWGDLVHGRQRCFEVGFVGRLAPGDGCPSPSPSPSLPLSPPSITDQRRVSDCSFKLRTNYCARNPVRTL
jgi:hypothetical protein